MFGRQNTAQKLEKVKAKNEMEYQIHLAKAKIVLNYGDEEMDEEGRQLLESAKYDMHSKEEKDNWIFDGASKKMAEINDPFWDAIGVSASASPDKLESYKIISSDIDGMGLGDAAKKKLKNIIGKTTFYKLINTKTPLLEFIPDSLKNQPDGGGRKSKKRKTKRKSKRRKTKRKSKRRKTKKTKRKRRRKRRRKR